MTLPQRPNGRKWNYLGLSFAFPAGLMLILMFVSGAEPFGKQTMLYSDMFHQYYPFFYAYRDAIRSGKGLLWNWSVGMGMDYLGMISYYLASPLNLLSVLVPEGWVLEYFSLLMPTKLGLAGLFFAWMLKKLFGRDDLSLVMFGGLYALCAWAIGYQWNIMWLDGFMLLPLVALGTVELLRDKKFILYTVTLFLAVAANYYVGFFVCIFVFLLFWCYEICRFKSIGRFFSDFLRIAPFTVLALGMTAFITLPAYAALQTTYSSVNQFPEGFQMNIVANEALETAKKAWTAYKTAKEAGEGALPILWEALVLSAAPILEGMSKAAGQLGGGTTPTYIDGLPNLYCGVLPLALGFLFLMSKEVKLRDKLCSVGLLIFFMLSILIRQLDYIWHGFHFTNQIPYRFSFLFSFVLLYMAYRAWLVRDKFELWQIILAGGGTAILFLLDGDKRSNISYLSFNFAFLALYFAVMLYGHRDFIPEKETADMSGAEASGEVEPPKPTWQDRLPDTATRRRQAALATACIITAELVLNLVTFGTTFGIYSYDYPKNDANSAPLLSYMKENEEELFYRTEVTHAQTLNDGALNGYYGLSTFSSSANASTTRFLASLGAGGYDSWNRYCYEDGSPVSNLFLNLKYQLEREFTPGENSYWDVVKTEGNATLLQNNAWLPLGFMVKDALADFNFTASDGFTMQNRLFRTATGLTGDVWTKMKSSDGTVIADKVTTHISNVAGYTSFTTGSEGGTLTYSYNISKAGYMCLDLNLYQQNDFTVYINGTKLYSETYSLPQILAVCDVKPGDNVQVVVTCKPNMANTSISIAAAVMDETLFRQGYDILNTSTLQLTEFDTTYISGTIDVKEAGLLYTSIPQNGNWVCYVDGEKVETTLVGEAMLAVTLTTGEHTVEFRYQNMSFILGLGISLACGLILLQFVILERKKK